MHKSRFPALAPVAAAALSVVTLSALAPTAGATTTYTLSINDNGTGALTLGSFALYGEVSPTVLNQANVSVASYGLAGFGADLQNYATVSNQSPRARYSDVGGVEEDVLSGFTLLRSASGSDPSGSQDTTSNATTKYVFGFGQTGGNLQTSPPAGYAYSGLSPTSYAPKLLLATGTYSGTAPSFVPGSATTFANVFTDTTNVLTGGPPTTADTVVTQVVTIPEPAGLGLLAAAALGFGRRRRA